MARPAGTSDIIGLVCDVEGWVKQLKQNDSDQNIPVICPVKRKPGKYFSVRHFRKYRNAAYCDTPMPISSVAEHLNDWHKWSWKKIIKWLDKQQEVII